VPFLLRFLKCHQADWKASLYTYRSHTGFCSKVVKYQFVLSVVSFVVNYSGSNGLKHGTFHGILQEADAERVNSMCHTEVP